MICRPPSGEAESVGPEQGFTQTVAQASPQPLTTQYCRRGGSSSSSSMIVRQCQQQRVFASWGWVWSGPRSPHSTAELYTNCRILSHRTCLNPSAVPSNMSLRELFAPFSGSPCLVAPCTRNAGAGGRPPHFHFALYLVLDTCTYVRTQSARFRSSFSPSLTAQPPLTLEDATQR